ncbi:hypothetical protein chiPu_0003062 [Chiloscyllium punctatum]|uniref:Uncharacterized protein n=1 Tax=Chiloscyllium punctatum TaxID=137246 RepID=A0A401S2P2_CHIPU|nr:hypothetical protein [Chiloscyllium punctatum]
MHLATAVDCGIGRFVLDRWKTRSNPPHPAKAKLGDSRHPPLTSAAAPALTYGRSFVRACVFSKKDTAVW